MSFWHDSWLPVGPLSAHIPALFSHTTCPEATIAHALNASVENILAPRLTRVGAAELASLRSSLDVVALSHGRAHMVSWLFS
jgi:hypothetical protein